MFKNKDVQTNNRYMKVCSTSVMARALQIKTKLTYDLTRSIRRSKVTQQEALHTVSRKLNQNTHN